MSPRIGLYLPKIIRRATSRKLIDGRAGGVITYDASSPGARMAATNALVLLFAAMIHAGDIGVMIHRLINAADFRRAAIALAFIQSISQTPRSLAIVVPTSTGTAIITMPTTTDVDANTMPSRCRIMAGQIAEDTSLRSLLSFPYEFRQYQVTSLSARYRSMATT